MKEITIKIFEDGEEISTRPVSQHSSSEPQLDPAQRDDLQAALDEVQSVLENHGQGLMKPVQPIHLMSLKRKLERVLGVPG